MLRVRGILLLSTLNQVRVGLPPGGWSSLWEGLGAEARLQIERPIDPAGWVPAPVLTGIMEAFASVLPEDPARTYWRLGRQSCDDTLTSVYRLMSRLARPEFVLRRAVRVWSDFYDRGDFEVLETLPESGAVRVTGAGFPHPALCGRIGGWIERAIELSGGLEVKVEHPVCTFAGGDCEEWRARWRL